jgi:hypothetical protein
MLRMRELVAFQLVRLAAAGPALDPNIVLPATLTLIGVLGAAWLASRASRSRPRPPATPEQPVVAPSPLAAFSGTQNEFMALVIADNEAIRSEVAGLRSEVAGLRQDLEEARSSHGAFERAVRRYLELLATAWVGPEPMPWPANDDLGILERTLPRRSRRTPRAN